MRIISTTALAAITAAGLATAADARRVTVDTGIEPELGGCSLDFGSRVDALCEPVGLGFTINIQEPEPDGAIFDYSSVVLYDDGFISFGGEAFAPFPYDINDFGVPFIAARFEVQDKAPSGQFVSVPILGPDTFRVNWYNANLIWKWTEFDEKGNGCCSGFLITKRQRPHARLLIESMPGNGARITLRWTEGASNFGYVLGKDVRPLGGNGERKFQFFIGDYRPVPEPATWAMMIAGFGLVGVAARRRARLAAV